MLLLGYFLVHSVELRAQQEDKHEWLKLSSFYKGTDIYGQPVNMVDTLHAHKRVLLYFFTVWDEASYYYHQQGILRDLTQIGDGQAISVWLVEIQGAPREAIEGRAPYPSDTNSRGDWTTYGGVQAPYTIISDKQLAEAIGVKTYYLPTTYLVCPSGFYIDCYPALESEHPVEGISELSALCLTESDPPRDIKIIAPERSEVESPCRLSLFVRTYSPITSYEWTMEGGNPHHSNDAEPKVSWSQSGDYTITLTVANEHGQVSQSTSIHVIDCSKGIETLPYVEDFEQDLKTYPDCWHLFDEDGDGINWRCLYQEQQDIPGMPSSAVVHLGHKQSANCMVSWSSFPIKASWQGGELSFDLTPQDAFNWLVLPKISIPGDAPAPTLHYAVKSLSGSDAERYSIFLSERGYKRSDFTHVLASQLTAPAGGWAERSISLASFAGKDVYIAIKHADSNKLALFLDDVAVTTDGKYEALPTVDRSDGKMRAYQYESTLSILLDNTHTSRLSIYNPSGILVYTRTDPSDCMDVDVSGWTPGCYIIVLKYLSGRSTIDKVMIRE